MQYILVWLKVCYRKVDALKLHLPITSNVRDKFQIKTLGKTFNNRKFASNPVYSDSKVPI